MIISKSHVVFEGPGPRAVSQRARRSEERMSVLGSVLGGVTQLRWVDVRGRKTGRRRNMGLWECSSQVIQLRQGK